MKTFLALLLLIPTLSWGLDQDELREQLKYWKSLLDDDLINQEDYDKQKEKLINLSNNINTAKAEEITKVDEDKDKKIDNTSEDFITTLSENQIRRVQDYLRQLGLYNGSIDGLLGPKTISAMKTWMKSKNDFKNFFEIKDYNNLQYEINFKKQKKLEQLELDEKAKIKQKVEQMKTYCLGAYYYTTYSSCFNDDKQVTKNEFESQTICAPKKNGVKPEFCKTDEKVAENSSSEKKDNGSTMEVDLSFKEKNYINHSLKDAKKWSKISEYCTSKYYYFPQTFECLAQNTKNYKMYSKGKEFYDIYLAYGEMLSFQVLGKQISEQEAMYYLKTKQKELNDASINKKKAKWQNWVNTYNSVNNILNGSNNNYNQYRNSNFNNGHKICSIDKMGRNINSPTSTYSIQCY